MYADSTSRLVRLRVCRELSQSRCGACYAQAVTHVFILARSPQRGVNDAAGLITREYDHECVTEHQARTVCCEKLDMRTLRAEFAADGFSVADVRRWRSGRGHRITASPPNA